MKFLIVRMNTKGSEYKYNYTSMIDFNNSYYEEAKSK